ncbi:MAG: sodium ion-translocating decarboxylase subunit beta [Blastochloris sp.]|nr:sodium ion-translocating decarboxylase subunit beta [Blastochloris sp.]
MLEDFLSFFKPPDLLSSPGRCWSCGGSASSCFFWRFYKQFEPLLLVPIAFGAFIANLPTHGVLTVVEKPNGVYDSGYVDVEVYQKAEPRQVEVEAGQWAEVVKLRIETIHGGLYDFLSQGIKLEIFPPLIFLGVGALTDFGPLIANPRTLFLGAAAQFGIFSTFFGACLLGFNTHQAASIAIIGGADGPTSIFTANKLAPELLGPIAVAAYSYMALVPLIQPPIMRLLTTRKERCIRMKSLRPVSREEKLVFCLLVTLVCILLVPDASALVAMLMLGNFLRECGVTDRLVKASQNEIINIITIFLGTSVGITMQGERFLQTQTLKIIVLGVLAFGLATAGGVLMAKVMNLLVRSNPINPLIGSAGVSAVPMAARVSHLEGQRADPNNYLLMHAMGPNVAGVIGTAVAAGYFISTLR